MAECPLMEGCKFYNGQLPQTTELLKNAVCRGKHESCARYIVASASGRQRVPVDLYPSDLARANDIIEKNKV
jgi:hypothetical protein